MRYRASVLLIIAVLFGGMAAYMVNQLVRGQMPGQVAPVMQSGRDTVVASIDLPPGTLLQRTHLRIVELPENAYPADSFTSIDQLLETDAAVVTAITAGEVVLPGRLTIGHVSKGLTARIPDGQRAVSIPVNAVRGVGGFVLPGDRVDVMHTSSAGRRDEQLVTRTLLQGITVLGVDQLSAQDEENPVVANVVTLLTTLEQAKMLTLAQHAGTLTLALRNGVDNSDDSSTTIALNNLWQFEPGEAPAAVAAEQPKPAARTRFVEVIRGLAVDKEKLPETNDAVASF